MKIIEQMVSEGRGQLAKSGQMIMSPYDFEKLCRAHLLDNPKASFIHVLIILTCSKSGHEWTDVIKISKALGLKNSNVLSQKKIEPSKKLGFVETRMVDAVNGLSKHQLRITEQVHLVSVDSYDGLKMQKMHKYLTDLIEPESRLMMTPLAGLILIAIHIRNLKLTKHINNYIGGDVTLWQARIKIMQKMAVAGQLVMKEIARGAKAKFCVTPITE